MVFDIGYGYVDLEQRLRPKPKKQKKSLSAEERELNKWNAMYEKIKNYKPIELNESLREIRLNKLYNVVREIIHKKKRYRPRNIVKTPEELRKEQLEYARAKGNAYGRDYRYQKSYTLQYSNNNNTRQKSRVQHGREYGIQRSLYNRAKFVPVQERSEDYDLNFNEANKSLLYGNYYAARNRLKRKDSLCQFDREYQELLYKCTLFERYHMDVLGFLEEKFYKSAAEFAQTAKILAIPATLQEQSDTAKPSTSSKEKTNTDGTETDLTTTISSPSLTYSALESIQEKPSFGKLCTNEVLDKINSCKKHLNTPRDGNTSYFELSSFDITRQREDELSIPESLTESEYSAKVNTATNSGNEGAVPMNKVVSWSDVKVSPKNMEEFPDELYDSFAEKENDSYNNIKTDDAISEKNELELQKEIQVVHPVTLATDYDSYKASAYSTGISTEAVKGSVSNDSTTSGIAKTTHALKFSDLRLNVQCSNISSSGIGVSKPETNSEYSQITTGDYTSSSLRTPNISRCLSIGRNPLPPISTHEAAEENSLERDPGASNVVLNPIGTPRNDSGIGMAAAISSGEEPLDTNRTCNPVSVRTGTFGNANKSAPACENNTDYTANDTKIFETEEFTTLTRVTTGQTIDEISSETLLSTVSYLNATDRCLASYDELITRINSDKSFGETIAEFVITWQKANSGSDLSSRNLDNMQSDIGTTGAQSESSAKSD